MLSHDAVVVKPIEPKVTVSRTKLTMSSAWCDRSTNLSFFSVTRTAPTASWAQPLTLPDRIRKLVVYEPAWPHILSAAQLAPVEALAATGALDDFAFAFFRDLLSVPVGVLEELRATELWAPIVADAPASLGDLRAIARYAFKPERFSGITCPVLLQIGSESPRELYTTDALAAVLPHARIEVLPGQAHEGMTTAPDMYAESVAKFLLG
jgi:pimeloyl-ACP methyl ester carboxylesterase